MAEFVESLIWLGIGAEAQSAGLTGILVKTGKYRPETEGTPDLPLQSVAELPEALGV